MARNKAARVNISKWGKDKKPGERPKHETVFRSQLGPVLHDLLIDEEIKSVIITYKDGSMTSYFPTS